MQIKLIALLLLGSLPTQLIFAQDPVATRDPIATHARVDVIADSDTATLSGGKWSFVEDAFAQRMTWLTDKPHAATYFSEFSIVDFAAPPNVFSFVSDEDTQVQLELSGVWRANGRGGAKRLMVDWKGFEVSGAKLIGEPFQARTAWGEDPIRLKILVNAAVPIYIKVAAQAHRNTPVDPSAARQDTRAHKLAAKLKRGINLSNWLEVPPKEDWGDNACDAKDFAEIKRNGFDHVRVPIGWHHQTGPRPSYAINQSIYRKVDRVVQLATQSNLAVILNIHHFDAFTTNPLTQRAKLVALWKQISQRYAKQSDLVFFEILNEPKDDATAEVMNDVYAEIIRVVRETNPDRGILVGPAEFNSVNQLDRLRLPADDDALIVSVHNYDPFPFTHQGTSWTSLGLRRVRGVEFPGPNVEKIVAPADTHDSTARWVADFNAVRDSKFNVGGPLPIIRMLEIAKGWSDTHGRPVHLGEFGAFAQIDDVSRASYYATVRKQAEQRGIGWAAWSWKADFAYYDERRKTPRPGMKAALLD